MVIRKIGVDNPTSGNATKRIKNAMEAAAEIKCGRIRGIRRGRGMSRIGTGSAGSKTAKKWATKNQNMSLLVIRWVVRSLMSIIGSSSRRSSPPTKNSNISKTRFWRNCRLLLGLIPCLWGTRGLLTCFRTPISSKIIRKWPNKKKSLRKFKMTVSIWARRTIWIKSSSGRKSSITANSKWTAKSSIRKI